MRPWEETWTLDGDSVERVEGGKAVEQVALVTGDEARGRLMAAAPALVRALCWVECSGYETAEGDLPEKCPCCGRTGPRWISAEQRWEGPVTHEPGCALDAALTAAGLDAEAREAVRAAHSASAAAKPVGE